MNGRWVGLRLLSQSRSPRPWVSRCCIVESHIQNWAFCRRHGAISDRIAEAHLCLDTIRATALGGPGMVPHAELQGVWSNGRARKLIKAQPPVTFKYVASRGRQLTLSRRRPDVWCARASIFTDSRQRKAGTESLHGYATACAPRKGI
jgi:hypothetical protein